MKKLLLITSIVSLIGCSKSESPATNSQTSSNQNNQIVPIQDSRFMGSWILDSSMVNAYMLYYTPHTSTSSPTVGMTSDSICFNASNYKAYMYSGLGNYYVSVFGYNLVWDSRDSLRVYAGSYSASGWSSYKYSVNGSLLILKNHPLDSCQYFYHKIH